MFDQGGFSSAMSKMAQDQPSVSSVKKDEYIPEKKEVASDIKSLRQWANVTEPKITPSKYKTDDYIDILENKPLKKNKTVSLKPDEYVPEVSVTEIDAPTEKEAETMMAEDFGKKEFNAYQNIGKINKDIIFKSEEAAVKELREKFKGSGFIFEETGIGNTIKISTSTDGGLSTINSMELDLVKPSRTETKTGLLGALGNREKEGEEAYNKLVDFMNKSILKKTDKDFLNKEVKDYGQLVNLMADNPYKYGEEFLNQYSTDRWFDNKYKDLIIESKNLKKNEEELLLEYNNFIENPTSPEAEAQLKNKINSLEERKDILKSQYDDLGRLNEKLKVSSAVYYKNKEKQGNTLGLISKSFIKGAFNMEKALLGITADVMPYVLPEGSMMPDVQREKLKASGMTDVEINDYASKQLRSSVIPQIEKGLTDLVSFGTEDQYIQSEDRNDLEKVASFLSESIGTAMSSGGNPLLQKVAFFSQSYNAIEDEMNSSDFDGLSQFEKKLISVPYAMTIGALERIGFKFTTGVQKNPLFNKLVNNIVFKTFSNLPKDASATLMQNELKRNTGAMLAATGLRIVGGALVEGGVEGVQQLDEIAIKNISNAITDKDYFKDVPDITTAKGVNEAIGAAATDFYYGALGGLIMSSGAESVSAIRNGYNNRRSDDEFAVFSNSLKDNNLRSSIESDIKSKILSGDITKEEAKAQIESMNKSYSILQSIPDKLSTRDQRESFNLILEKQKITKETEGKDPALVTAQTERINEINEELKNISKNAVQVETTGEVPVQPEARVGEEVVQGESEAEPQSVTEEGQKEVEVLRAKEITEFKEEIDNADDFITDGKIDAKKIEASDNSKAKEIYAKYDKLISPLLEAKGKKEVVSGIEIVMPTEQQAEERKAARSTSEYVDNAAKDLPEISVEEMKEELNGEFGMLSGENPMAKALTEEENVQLNNKAVTWLKSKGYNPKRIIGKYGQAENSFFVPGLKRADAIAFAKEFNQDSVAHSDGLVYQDGSMNPRVKENDDFSFGEYTPESDYVSVVKTPEGLRTVSVGYDFENKISPDNRTVSDQDNLITQDNFEAQRAKQTTAIGQKIVTAAKLVMKALPGIKIYIHQTAAEYEAATGQKAKDIINKKEYFDKGGYINGAIHINLEYGGDLATLYHEAIHYALEVKGMRSGAILDLAKGLKAIISDKNLKKYLDNFIKDYKDDGKAEEYIAELGAIMAEEKMELTTSKFIQFKALLGRIASKLGIPAFGKAMQAKDAADFINNLTKAIRTGEEIKVEGFQSEIIESKGIKKQIKVRDDYKLSFVKQSDIIDIDSLIKEIASKGQKVWFWMADQLGRGYVYDEVSGENHYLDAGPSFALDPENRSERIVWASGLKKKTLQSLIDNSDYIFLVSGSPDTAKLFNKAVFDLYVKKIGDYNSFKKEVLNNAPTKGMKNLLEKYKSWEEIKESNDRKKMLSEFNNSFSKPNSKLNKILSSKNALINVNSIRDDFYADNNFQQNDIMMVLKPEKIGGKSKHSTYENDLIGDVVGVPDKVINAYDILSDEDKSKYKDVSNLNRMKQQAVTAPFGKGIRSVIKKQMISPENSSNYANLTEDDKGNFVFFHRGGNDYEVIKKSSGGTTATSRDEASAISKVGGVAMYYTRPTDAETMVQGTSQYAVKVKNDKVYDFNSDPLNIIKEARERFNKEYPGQAFNPNVQFAYVTKIANEKGYDMTVAEWDGRTRAQSVVELKPDDVQVTKGNQVVKNFNESYESNTDKGFKSVIPEDKQKKLDAVYAKIYKVRNSEGRYDNLYRLQEEAAKLTEDQITDMIVNSDLSQEIKDEYQEVVSAPVEERRSIKKQKFNKVTVNEMAALKDQIRLEARAARQAKGDLNAKRKMLAAAINKMAKLGSIKAKQAEVLLKRISTINLDNPVMVERFTDYAEKVFNKADYQNTLTNAFALRKSIRRLLKTDNQAQVVGMAREFAQIDPSMVEDIDAYIEMANIVKDAVKPTVQKGFDTVMKEAANIAKVSKYSKEMIAAQDEMKRKELIATYDYLQDISKDLSLKELQDIVNILKENQEANPDNQSKVMDFLKARMNAMAGILESMLKSGVDPITGEEITFDENQKELMKRVLKIDLSEMDIRSAIRIVEGIDNFLNNQITSGLEAAASSYEGDVNAKSLVARGKVARKLKLFFSGAVGKLYSEQLFSLPNLMEKMFGGVNNSIDIMRKMGLVSLVNGVNKANRLHNDIVDRYSKQSFYSTKGFMDAANVYERGMIAFLKRNLIGTESEMKAEFERRARIIKETIDTLREDGGATENKMADMYEEAYNKLGVDKMDLDVVLANASNSNLEAVDWWINEWTKYYQELSDVSLSVYNTMLGSDLNYTPDKYKPLSSETLEEGTTNQNGAFASDMNFTDKNKTGVLMESTRPKVLPKGRYISLDFDTNNSKALKAALIDINTAASIRQVDGFINSKAFKKLIPESDDRKILVKRINSYIRRAKGKNIVPSDTMQYVDKFTSYITSLGVGKALAGLNQTIMQTTPVMVNTLINAGRFDFATADFNQWLNETGMPISNRGLESQSAIESIDRRIEAKGQRIQETLRGVADLNQWYLKQLLVKPDVWVARSSFKSYYLQNLKRRGISTDIDWTNHEMDQEAAEYAQIMVDRQQNISDPLLAGEFLSSDNPMSKISRKIFLPFASFILNQKARMYNDLMTITSKTASKEDRLLATRSLAGLAAELTVYQALGYGIRNLYDMIASSLLGDDDEEEKNKKFLGLDVTKQQYNATKYPVKAFFNDIVSPLPIMDGATTWTLNKALEFLPYLNDADIKEAVKERNRILEIKGEDPMDKKTEAKFIENLKDEAKYQVFDDDFSRAFGMIGIAADTYTELGEVSKLAVTGEFTDEYQGRETLKKLLPEDKEKIQYTILPMLLYSTGLMPKDIGAVSKKYINKIKKRAITETQYEKLEEVQGELGRKLKGWEIDLVKTKRVPMDELNFIERNGGLTDAQGIEYVKLVKKIGTPSVSDIDRIKKNNTVDQILK
jgi:hypothetical protein